MIETENAEVMSWPRCAEWTKHYLTTRLNMNNSIINICVAGML